MKENWFIGWPVDAPLLDRAVEAPPRVGLFAPTDLHVTCAFLGPCGEERARRAFDRVPMSATALCRVRFGGVELFGHPKRGTALSATLAEGDAELSARVATLRAPLLRAAGAAPDERPPRPHVTLARIARRAPQRERAAAIEWARAIDLGGLEAHISRIALYTWAEDRTSTKFRVVAAVSPCVTPRGRTGPAS